MKPKKELWNWAMIENAFTRSYMDDRDRYHLVPLS